MEPQLSHQFSEWLANQLGLVIAELEEFSAIQSDLSLVYLGTAVATKLRQPLAREDATLLAKQVLQHFGSQLAATQLAHCQNGVQNLGARYAEIIEKAFGKPSGLQIQQTDDATVEIQVGHHPWVSEMMLGLIAMTSQTFAEDPAMVHLEVGSTKHFIIQVRQTNLIPISLAQGSALHSPPRALIVDDDADIRQFSCMVLQKMGWQVDTASDGQKALAVLYQQSFQLIMLDGDMPHLNGICTAEKIRAAEQRHRQPASFLIGISAKLSSQMQQQFLHAGCDVFLPKPLDTAYLEQILMNRFERMHFAAKQSVDPLIAPLVPQYLQQRLLDLQILKQALTQQDVTALLQLTHRIKGSACSYGLSDLSDLAALLEDHIQDRDFTAAADSLHAMTQLVIEMHANLPQLKQAL